MKRLLCLIGLITTTSGGGEIGRFLADYAQWRRWEQAAVFTTVRESISEATSATKSLNDGGVFTSLLSMEDVQLTASLIVPRHRLGVVLFLNQSGATDLLELVSQKLLFNCYLSWLLVIDDVTYDGEQLRNLNIGLDSDVTLAITGEQVACKQAECVKPNITLHQVYKVRATSNTSLVVERLGAWNVVTKMTSMGTPSDVERRGDLKGYPLIVGVRQVVDADQLTEAVDEDRDNDMNLLEVLDYISGSLNTSYELIPYSKLGWRNDEGAWVHLLGAVTQGAVDLGLDSVSVNQERAKDMAFSHPLVQSMRNIYFRRPDTGAMRDIFLAPFSSRLLACVTATAAVLGLAVVVVNAVQPSSTPPAPRRQGWGIGDAFVWSISVLTMQGSPWNPSTPSGSVILIFSLCFALIIYNAYAAFITAILSVHATAINSLEDLVDSELRFGYTTTTIPSSDDVFLRTSDDLTLRKLYLQGLLHNHGVPDATTGMRRAADGGYAFFVSARIARNSLKTLIAHEKRCNVQELVVETSKTVLAFPMNYNSPYKRLINLSLLRMKETGVLDRMKGMILPEMPSCLAVSTFNSARFTDVYSAFSMLGLGVVSGMLLGIGEGLWRWRTRIGKGIVKWCNGREREVVFGGNVSSGMKLGEKKDVNDARGIGSMLDVGVKRPRVGFSTLTKNG